jgi:hypothetical protein
MKYLPWLLTGIMGFAALLLWLNFREVDHYELGSLDPVDGSAEAAQDLDRFLPRTISHEGHEHALEVVEQRRELTLRDRDGWYRLFWAGDEIYHYKELVHLAADLQNRTAADPTGRWTIHVRAAAAPCGTSPFEAAATYELRVSDGAFQPRHEGTLPEVYPACAYACRAAHLPDILSFAWVLAK